jgi:hypothetical protein
MSDLLEQALLPFNLPLTIALGVVVLFWLVVLLGFIGIDTFDMDLTPEVLEADTFSLPEFIGKLTNAADIPVTIILSLYTFFLWTASVLGNYYFNPMHSNLVGLAVLGGGLFVALALTKAITQPLVPIMRRMKNSEKAPPVIGQSGTVTSLEVDGKFGQVSVEREGGAPALLICKTSDGALPIPRGTEVLIIAHDDATSRYIVRAIAATHDPLLSTSSNLPQINPGYQSSSASIANTEKELS